MSTIFLYYHYWLLSNLIVDLMVWFGFITLPVQEPKPPTEELV